MHTLTQCSWGKKKKKKMKLFAHLLGNVQCSSLGLKSWLFFMAAQHKAAHWKAGSPTATRQERGKGLKAGGWGILGERDPNTQKVTVVKKRPKAVTRWNKTNCPQRETGAPLEKRLSSKLGDPFLVTRSGQVDSWHPSSALLDEASRVLPPQVRSGRWKSPARTLRSRGWGKEMPAVPWSRLGRAHQAAGQPKCPQFSKGFLSIVTTGVRVCFLRKEGVMKDNVICICKPTLCNRHPLALRGCLLPCRLPIRVTLPWVGEGLGSSPYRIRWVSLSSTARQGGRILGGGPGSGWQRLKLLGFLSPAPLPAAQLLVTLVAAAARWWSRTVCY